MLRSTGVRLFGLRAAGPHRIGSSISDLPEFGPRPRDGVDSPFRTTVGFTVDAWVECSQGALW
jgi:hypothetical protein